VKRLALALGVIVALAALWREFTRPRVPEGPLPVQLDWLVGQAREADRFSGTVLVARAGTVLFARTVGFADSATRVLNGITTPFPLASVSKPFTALLILQLVETGQLALTDSLVRFFPELTGVVAGGITIDQLLSHTSGIEEIISRDPQQRIAPAHLMSAVVRPGGDEYSNTGYVVLALVAEAVTGVPYPTVLSHGILDPAGMASSGVLRPGTDLSQLARGDGGTRAVADIGAASDAIDGAGSMFANASDLVRFDRALAGGQLLPASRQQRMLEEGRFPGWMVSEQDGVNYMWHSGNLPGYSAYLARIPARDELVVVLSNRTDADVRGMARSLLRQLKQQP
jgi:CubicO group peptidase (beta-lactamase class C family)